MLNFAEQTGSGAVIVVWSLLEVRGSTSNTIMSNSVQTSNPHLLL